MGADLAGRVAGFAAGLDPAGPYRDPSPRERWLAVAATGHLFTPGGDASAATAALTGLGFSHTGGRDAVTGRRYAWYADQPRAGRSFGVLLVDLSAPVRLIVEVPHPNSDLRTERLGVDLFRLVPGSILVVAGAHRRAGDGAADAAHNDRSLFNTLATEAANRRLPQIQLHGFADASLPGLDAVVSTGTRAATPSAVRVATTLREAGLVTCEPWRDSRGRLEGAGNVQALTAARLGATFIHLELSWRVRRDQHLRATAVRAIATALSPDPGDVPGSGDG